MFPEASWESVQFFIDAFPGLMDEEMELRIILMMKIILITIGSIFCGSILPNYVYQDVQ